MKKIIALLLAVLMVLSMVACASKTTDDTPADTTPADHVSTWRIRYRASLLTV